MHGMIYHDTIWTYQHQVYIRTQKGLTNAHLDIGLNYVILKLKMIISLHPVHRGDQALTILINILCQG